MKISHRNIREGRLPGTLFRAMGVIYLRLNPESSRGLLARRLQAQLASIGTHYDVRTVKRQLTGAVSTVPACVQDAMQHLLLRETFLQSKVDIEFTLWSAGLSPSPDQRRPIYVSTSRIVPLVQLWSTINPTRSRRSLAVALTQRIADSDEAITVDALQVILAGRQTVARREILDELLIMLDEQGITSETDARSLVTQNAEAIDHFLAYRKLLPVNRLSDLAIAWKVHSAEPSSRRLAVMLREKLMSNGLELSLRRIQDALDGKAKNVRAALITETESLLRGILPAGTDLSSAASQALGDRTRLIDMSWVRAQPVAFHAKRWLAMHPDASMRQLAIGVSRTARDMGYATSANSIQPVLGGHKKRTRGFVYRAVLKQLPDRNEQVPAQHVLPTRWLKGALPSFRVPQVADDRRSELPAEGPLYL
jgi:hypothetical protein